MLSPDELNRPVAVALGRRQLDPVLGTEISLKGLGRLSAAFGLLAFFVDKAADELFHRGAGMPRFALEPGLVARVDIADGDGGTHRGDPFGCCN